MNLMAIYHSPTLCIVLAVSYVHACVCMSMSFGFRGPRKIFAPKLVMTGRKNASIPIHKNADIICESLQNPKGVLV